METTDLVGTWETPYEQQLCDLCCRYSPGGLTPWAVDQISIYSEMLSRNVKSVESNGTGFDEILLGEEDNRRCWASYAFFTEPLAQFSDAFHELSSTLSTLFPTHVLYRPFPQEPSAARLHYTYMQHIGFDDFPDIKPSEKMISLLGRTLESSLGPFSITYVGLIPLRSGIVMIGFPSTDVNSSRSILRSLCQREDMDLREPYLNNIVHSTLLRFTSPLDSSQLAQLFKICEEYRVRFLGKAMVTSFSYGPASWKMSVEELLRGVGDTNSVALWSRAWLGRPFRPDVRSRSCVITHRGLEPARIHALPESSLTSFTDHITRGFSIEFDPFLSCDDVGYVCHDTYTTNEGVKARLSTLTSAELDQRGVTRLDDVFDLICSFSTASHHSLHLKGDRQQPKFLEYLVGVFNQRVQLKEKVFIFDVAPPVAAFLKQGCPGMRLGASVSHGHDIDRYNSCVYGTLVSVDDFLSNIALYEWAWLDEWDTAGENGEKKSLISPDLIARLHEAGVKVAAVTPELHATSPGLLGGERHEDSSSVARWKKWVLNFISAGGDALCTDWPELVYEMMVFQE